MRCAGEGREIQCMIVLCVSFRFFHPFSAMGLGWKISCKKFKARPLRLEVDFWFASHINSTNSYPQSTYHTYIYTWDGAKSEIDKIDHLLYTYIHSIIYGLAKLLGVIQVTY